VGRLIAIEGIDGSGKGTQSRLLAQRLQAAGSAVKLLSFPRYQETVFGAKIGLYLNGAYGDLNAVDPTLVSLLFAGDRFESKPVLESALNSCDVLVLDRYVASNAAHQAAKSSGADRDALIGFIEQLEYEIYALPRADMTILLDLPVERAQQLIATKAARTYTDRAADLQEADAAYLDAVRELYLAMSRNDRSWRRVDVVCESTLRSVEDIADEVERLVRSSSP